MPPQGAWSFCGVSDVFPSVGGGWVGGWGGAVGGAVGGGRWGGNKHTRSLRRMRINSCISASCQLFFFVLSKRFPVASLALSECSAMYNPRAVALCLSCVLLLCIAKVPPPSRSPALLSAWRAYPFFLDQRIEVFAAVSVSDPVLDCVIAASAMPDRSPIDFRALCDDHHVLWSSCVSYVSRSRGALPLRLAAAAYVLSRRGG